MIRSRTHRWQATLLPCLVLLFLCAVAGAQSFSHVLSFQGRLAEPGGKPVPDGLYAAQFTIYDAETGGTALWQESQNVTQVGGVINVYLGTVTAFPLTLFAGGDRWLALRVGGDPEMAKRYRLTPSPWAIRSAKADEAVNADKVDNIHASASPTPNYLLPLDASGRFPTSVIPPDDDWTISGNNVYRLLGNVGIGINTPADRLTVTDGNIRLNNTADAKNWVLGYDPTGDYFYIDEYGQQRRLFIKNGGNVGIGASNPAQKLDVAGTTQMTGFKLTTSPVLGYVLKSDAAGVGTWQPDGIALPFDGSASSANPALKITNIGSGQGLSGVHSTSGNYGYLGTSDYGVEGQGNTAGGYFKDRNASGYGYIGYENTGILAVGDDMGGCFSHTGSTAFAYVGYGGRGIDARGNEVGGYFKDANGSGFAYVGYGERGIEGYGNDAGGYFKSASGTGYALVGYANDGISAHGTSEGGFFHDDDSTGSAHVAYGNRGIEATGSEAGGYFGDSNNSGRACVGYGDKGVYAVGNPAGDFLSLDGYSWAYLGDHTDGSWGITAYGDDAGGNFDCLHSGGWANVADWTGCKIRGTGSVNFVQNHPGAPDKVIVYACPEGDEVATYTRGTARLVNGVARVPLAETFKWVTNPDIGLTAHLTPRGDCEGLYVESLTTSEMVVRELRGGDSDVTFDYIVYGLRIGFEEVSIVQQKEREAPIPSMKYHRDLYEQKPGLRQYNALERFKAMRAATGQTGPLNLSASKALHDAIVEFNPSVHGIARRHEEVR